MFLEATHNGLDNVYRDSVAALLVALVIRTNRPIIRETLQALVLYRGKESRAHIIDQHIIEVAGGGDRTHYSARLRYEVLTPARRIVPSNLLVFTPDAFCLLGSHLHDSKYLRLTNPAAANI